MKNIASQSSDAFETCFTQQKGHNFRVHASPETLLKRGGITKHHSI